jgi:hypothetical protein
MNHYDDHGVGDLKARIAELEDKLDCMVQNMKSMEDKMILDQAKLAMIGEAFIPIEGNYFDASNTCAIISSILSDTRKPLAVVECHYSDDEWWEEVDGDKTLTIYAEPCGNSVPATVIVMPKEGE